MENEISINENFYKKKENNEESNGRDCEKISLNKKKSSSLDNISSDRLSFEELSDFDNSKPEENENDRSCKNDFKVRNNASSDLSPRLHINKCKDFDRREKHRKRRCKRRRSRSNSKERYYKYNRYDRWSRERDYLDQEKHRFNERSEYSSFRKINGHKRHRSRSPYYKEYQRNQSPELLNERTFNKKESWKYNSIKKISPKKDDILILVHKKNGKETDLNSLGNDSKKYKIQYFPAKKKKKERHKNHENNDKCKTLSKHKIYSDSHSKSEFEKNESNQCKIIHAPFTSTNNLNINTGCNNKKNLNNYKTASSLDLNNEITNTESSKNINSLPPSSISNTTENVSPPQSLPIPYAQSNLLQVNKPALSQDNVPLVLGPNGLPVHVTSTGLQIPYDMDGRKIPIGPYGYYLPLDPSGQPFPHIITHNFAAPIDITKDGILRLPNSEPVPFTFTHQLPINVDGQIILNELDTRSLLSYSNLQKLPPPTSLPLKNLPSSEMIPTHLPDHDAPITDNLEKEILKPPKPDPPTVDINSLDQVVESIPIIQKSELFKKYLEEVRQKKRTFQEYAEVEKNLGIITSKSGIRTSTPKKLIPRKKSKESDSRNSSDMDLDSSDSSPTNLFHKSIEQREDVQSSEEEGKLQIVCDMSTIDVMAFSEDPIIRRIQPVLKTLRERNFQSPPLGRFILPEVNEKFLSDCSLNASPLLRNRIRLPCISSCIVNFKDETTETTGKNDISFSFHSQKCYKNLGKSTKISKEENKKMSRIFTFDFAMQCDFTSEIIKSLNEKVIELSNEIVKLKNINANLKDLHRQQRNSIEMKTQTINKVLNEIEEKKLEIESLKKSREINKKEDRFVIENV